MVCIRPSLYIKKFIMNSLFMYFFKKLKMDIYNSKNKTEMVKIGYNLITMKVSVKRADKDKFIWICLHI